MERVERGTRVASYLLERELARGGQGAVWLARHSPTNRPVALKLLLAADPSAVKRFRQEARLATRLRHPNLLRAHEHGEFESVLFLASEFVSGQDLGKLVRDRGAPDLLWSARVLVAIAGALHYCHEHGLVHRDLKPGNIVVDGQTGRPVLIDLGLVKRDASQLELQSLDAHTKLSQSGSIKGTPEFMAPEQVNAETFGPVTPRTDVYGLGATLFTLITGRAPFQGSGSAVVVMRKVTRKAPPDPCELNPQVPRALADLCLRCLAKQPNDRPESAAALAVELAQLCGLPPPSSSPAPSRLSHSSDDGSDSCASRSTSERLRVGTPPQAIAGYAIERELARGGMGAVYVARHPSLGRQVALKIMLGESESGRQRFLLEAESTARLKHPNVVAIHEAGEHEGCPYLVMDLVEGESLKDRIKREGTLEEREAARITEGLARGLEAAHDQSILHRDMKPANVLLNEAGVPLITDFGLAKDVDSDSGLTATGVALGTPAFMPPEQAMGEKDRIDHRSDIYSLGATLYQMLTGRPPFDPEALNVMVAAVVAEPDRPSKLRPGLDAGLEAICLMCLAKERDDRYQSAADLAGDLTRWLAGDPIVARLPRRRRVRALVVALTAIALCVGAFAFHRSGGAISATEARARAEKLGDQAERWLGSRRSRLSEPPDLAAWRTELRTLEEGASLQAPPPNLARAQRAVRLIEGLIFVHEAQGDRARGVLEVLESAGANDHAAVLRGAIAIITTGSDAKNARADLARGEAAGVGLPALRGWRALALVGAGLGPDTQAEEVLKDLYALEKARDLSRAEHLALAAALLHLGRVEKAQELLDPLTPLPPDLATGLLLAQISQDLRRDAPARALERLEGRPPLTGSDDRREAVWAECLQRAGAPIAALARGDLPAGKERDELFDDLRLARAIRPEVPLREQAWRPILDWACATDTKFEVGIRLASLCPDTLEVQRRVGNLAERKGAEPHRLSLIPSIRRALTMTPEGKREPLVLCLVQTLQWQSPPRDVLEASSRYLAECTTDRARATLFMHMAMSSIKLEAYREALEYLERGVGVDPNFHKFAYYRAQAYRGLGETQRCYEHAVAYCRSGMEKGGSSHHWAVAWAWESGRSLGMHAELERILEVFVVTRPHKNAGWWVRLAFLQLRAGKIEASRASLKRAVETFGDFHSPNAKFKARAEALLEDVGGRGADATAKLEGLVDALEAERADGLRP